MPSMDVPWHTEYEIRDILFYVYVFYEGDSRWPWSATLLNSEPRHISMAFFGIQISGLYRLGVPRSTMR